MMSGIPWRHSLAVRFGLAFVLFVLAGSFLLLAWLRHQQRQESVRVFAVLARADADFVKSLNLPRSEKLARDLQKLLGMDIHFRDRGGRTEPPLAEATRMLLTQAPPGEDVYPLPNQREAIVVRLDDSHDMLFVRNAATPALSLLHPATRNALLAFALLSAALGWMVAGQVLRPLGSLTRRLPGFFAKSAATPPEAARQDEIGKLARALTQAREDLLEERQKREQSERLALLGRVATGLAHDIKNPVASIQLHAELMNQPDLPDDFSASLKLIRDEASVIEGLVNQWLYLARPASPKLARTDLIGALSQTLGSVQGQAEHAGVQIVAQKWDARQVFIQADRPRLQQAFRNILMNAIQAMPSGGFLKVSAVEEGTQVRISIQDTGAGFSATALVRGTDLFFSEKEGGMGVGLNVAGEIISAHGGKMMLKNSPKGGAEVEICLPTDTAHEQVPSSHA